MTGPEAAHDGVDEGDGEAGHAAWTARRLALLALLPIWTRRAQGPPDQPRPADRCPKATSP